MGRGAILLLKWIVAPAILAGVGYVFVGPRLGGELAEKAAPFIKKSGIKEKLNPTGNSDSDAPAKQAESSDSNGPDIRVKVKPAEPQRRTMNQEVLPQSEPIVVRASVPLPPLTLTDDPAGVGAGVP